MTAASANPDGPPPIPPSDEFKLTDEHRMLLDIRDTLYEGNWEDFRVDLQARADGRPHVFQTVSASHDMLATIRSHLALIEQMAKWETAHGRRLGGRSAQD